MDPKLADRSTWQEHHRVYTGKLNEYGYARIKRQKKKWYVHRYIWSLLHREIPPRMQVDHRCEIPACFSPWCLQLVPQRINQYWQHGTHCQRGHPRVAANKGADGRCRLCHNLRARAYRQRQKRQAIWDT